MECLCNPSVIGAMPENNQSENENGDANGGRFLLVLDRRFVVVSRFCFLLVQLDIECWLLDILF